MIDNQFRRVRSTSVRGEMLGVIYLGNDSITGLFSEDDLRLLKIWAAQAADPTHGASTQ